MKKGWTLTQESFDLLLEWLSADKGKAGAVYEQVRRGLMKLFLVRGCVDPEALVDETMNRVTSKLPAMIDKYQGSPIHYFYNVANKIYLENMSPRQKREEQLDLYSHSKYLGSSYSSDETNIHLDYLRECLQRFKAEDREILVRYFEVDKSAKFEHRRLLSEKKGATLNSLRVKIVRLKKKLRECVTQKMSADR